jgi:uncharacterized protein (TIGR02266 family)
MSTDSRENRRVNVRMQVAYSCIDDFLSDYASNVSLGGMFIETQETPLPVDTRFNLRFELSDQQRIVEARAVVMWVNVDGGLTRGMGVRFEGLSARDEQAVQQWLKERDAPA